jgi:hypothetical protein
MWAERSIPNLLASEWSTSRPRRFSPGERAPCTHWIGGWVDWKAGMDIVAKGNISTPSGNQTTVAQPVG